ncbi:MAG TPA: ATPase domain-containing protein [archaeon]|nr:ATPase domain-containing protein [archaeon]
MAKKEIKKDDVPRVSSGITGLDELIGGGFVPNDVYLITGGTGTGKTLFCCQFLWEGLQKGEKCIFFSLEELPQDVIGDAAAFGWDFQKYIDSGQCQIIYKDPFELIDVTTEVKEQIEKLGATRIVFDSTSIFGMVFKTPHELRQRMYQLIRTLKTVDHHTVVLMTAEIEEEAKGLSRFGVEEFVADGVIVLYYVTIGGESFGNLQIRKMRRTNHAHGIFPTKITKNGINVENESTVLMK